MAKLIEIFRVGRHTAMSGQAVSFSEADLRRVANSYNPSRHEAPVVLGHPTDNAPAFGWVKALHVRGDKLLAAVDQLEPSFAEAVGAGRYKKVSASFYSPSSPANPTPGQYHLRHVGFLGAQPPAVKGLAPVAFAEGEHLAFDFADDAAVGTEAQASAAQATDAIVGQASSTVATAVTEVVARLVVAGVVADLATAFPELDKAKLEQLVTESTAKALATPPEGETSGSVVQATIAGALTSAVEAPLTEAMAATPADGAAAASLDHSEATSAKELELRKREEALAFAERKARRGEFEVLLAGHAREGRRLPFQRAHALDLLEAASQAPVLSFGEGQGPSPLELTKQLIAALPKVVNFREISGGAVEFGEDTDPSIVAQAAQRLQASEAAKGNRISTSEAVRLVKQGAR